MKGLELARGYYETYGRPMLEQDFPEWVEQIAVGLAGQGSECMGYDDALSEDHDFEPGFCLWIPERVEAACGFRLERAYDRLPRDYGGYRRLTCHPVGGRRHGVWRIEAFYQTFLGAPEPPGTVGWWLDTPSAMLGMACNGTVFRDDLGAFSAVRATLLQGYPEDIRRKKLAAHTLMMAQAGSYNYGRCMQRGETGAAQLALYLFVRHAISAVYLLNGRYEPFYKWAYRGMRDLPVLGRPLEGALTGLTQLGVCAEDLELKATVLEEVAEWFADAYREQGLDDVAGSDLEAHAYGLMRGIRDGVLRTMHIMDGVPCD